MSDYIPFKEIPEHLPIKRNDILYISSDALGFAKTCRAHGELFDPEDFVRALQKAVGEEGTLLFPTFNWDFCRGSAFDYAKTPGKTGVLGNVARKMPEFQRTKHPIYSFAVWGKDADKLCSMENIESFGEDSPFGYLRENDSYMLVLGEPSVKGYTFLHYVERRVGVPYRYTKSFTGEYIDQNGHKSNRTYTMYVRDMDIDPIRKDAQYHELNSRLELVGGGQEVIINGMRHCRVSLTRMYSIASDDIANNGARMLYNFGNEALLQERIKDFRR